MQPSFLLETGMTGKPCVEALQSAFAQREGRVGGVLDLRYCGPTNAGKDAQFGAVELAMWESLREQEQ